MEVWNGLAWMVQPNPGAGLSDSGLFGVSCNSSRFCIAIGEHGDYGLVEAWNGISWRIQTTPTVARYGTWPTGISCLTADWCTLVGGYNTVKRVEQAVGVPLAEHWNGRRWRVQHAPAYGLYFPALSSVSCVSRSFCLASGIHFLDQQGIPSPFAERWNGRHWTAARAGLPKYSSLNSVSCLSTVDCLAVGQFEPSLFAAPDTAAPLLESWNGSPLGAPRRPPSPGTAGDVRELGRSGSVRHLLHLAQRLHRRRRRGPRQRQRHPGAKRHGRHRRGAIEYGGRALEGLRQRQGAARRDRRLSRLLRYVSTPRWGVPAR